MSSEAERVDWGDVSKEGGVRGEPEDLEALDFATFEHVGEVARRKELGSAFRDYRELQHLAVGAEMEREVRSAVDGGGRRDHEGPFAERRLHCALLGLLIPRRMNGRGVQPVHRCLDVLCHLRLVIHADEPLVCNQFLDLGAVCSLELGHVRGKRVLELG